ncbi:coagulation factor XIII B chain-like [Pagrus major]|uniref:coagulation factor XIII B chain-like n=1 Tax=Pagrus major TaxID=143350 RepID=UPI003CC8B120
MRLFHLLWLFILWLKMEKSSQRDAIKCTVPVIENGNVPGDTQEYNEHEVLYFECNPNYIPTDHRPTTCTKQRGRAEWIPTPYCETTKCRLTLPPLEGTIYEPAYRNVFKPGDTVRVICGERYGISNTQNTSATVTCNDDGDWTVRPLCKEVTCSVRRDPLVGNWNVQRLTLNGTARYTCRSGYRSKDGTNLATCTRDGWRPKPLCQAQQCPVIRVDDNVQVNGDPEEATYGNVVRFSCKSNTEILLGPTEIYCDESGLWSGEAPKCKALKCRLTLPPLEGTSYEPAFRNVFTPDEQVTVTCGEKYWISNPRDTSAVTTCTATGDWTVRPVCKEVTCRNQRERNVNYWDVYWGQRITLGDTARYRCRSGYKSTDGTNLATCTRDGWRPNPLCQDIAYCNSPPRVENAFLFTAYKNKYLSDSEVTYQCHDGYTMDGENTLRCREGEWEKKNINCTTIARYCHRPPRIENAFVVTSYQEKYLFDSEVTYQCHDDYTMVGENTLRCREGGWEKKNIKCTKP